MNEHAYGVDPAEPVDHARGDEEDPVIRSNTNDPVDAAVSAYLDYLEGHGEPPDLDSLAADDRRHAEQLIDVMRAGRGIDPHTSTPSLEELLAGTEIESALALLSENQTDSSTTPPLDKTSSSRLPNVADQARAHTELIEHHLHGVDPRVITRIGPHPVIGPAVTVSYLDLHTVFFPIERDEPTLTDDIHALVDRMFALDADLDYVGVVAVGSSALLTQVLSCSDFASTLVTPSDRLNRSRSPVLPLPLSLRRLLERSAPAWEPLTFDATVYEPLDLTTVVTQVTRQVVPREVGRRYRGEKARAYKSFAGAEAAFVDLIATLGTGAAEEQDIAGALDRFTREAA